MRPTTKRCLIVCAVLTVLIAAPPGRGQEEEPASPGVSVVAVSVTPEQPGADTLCRLTVRLTNHGDQVASQLGFQVAINGANVPVYDNQLFMYPLQPGATADLSLFNFWSTETSRPFPADGTLRVEVRLVEAQWTKIEDVEGVETWTPLGAVPGLPVSRTTALKMKK